MTAAMGHNMSKAERDRRILFAHYHRKDRDIAAKVRALNEEKKGNRKNAKASGFPAAKLDHYLKSFLADNQDKPVLKHQSEKENLIWLGLINEDPKGDLLSDRASPEEVVRAKGFHAGLCALDRVSGYMAGTDEDHWWLTSYDAGKAEYDTILPDILERVNAAKSKEEPAPSPDNGDPFAD